MDDRFLSRGKSKGSGEWVEGFLYPVKYTGFSIPGGVDYYIVVYPSGGGMQQIQIDPSTLGGCTGLTDKNDKLIFEGDIVSVLALNLDGSEDNMIGVIEWRKGAFSVAWNEEKYGRNFLGYLGKTEVIGNIHDNPELLESEAAQSDP